MNFRGSSAITQDSGEHLFQGLLHGGQARALRAQLASRHPQRSAEEIEDAVQAACESFLDQEESISEPGPLYGWIRTVAHRTLIREDGSRRHELAVDPIEGGLERAASEAAGPEEELIALEDDTDLEILVGEVASSLSGRRREVLALWAAGNKRPEIASRIGLSERAVKRDLIAIMEEARAAVARRAGGGCERGEPLVLRFAYGLASSAEAAQARLHLDRCRRCATFSERLDVWREKAGVLLPLPVVEGASPGLVERVAHRAAHGISAVKQQVLGGGTELRQQATATYSRSVDPTPLAAVRPGAVVAVVAGCIAVGSGATYCAQQGVDPLGAAKNLIVGTQESEAPPSSPPSESTEPTPVAPPPPPVTYEPPVAEVTETAPPAEVPAEAEPEPAPPPEESFEPAPPVEPTPESAPAEPASESAPVVRPKPAAAPAGDAPQFGGP